MHSITLLERRGVEAKIDICRAVLIEMPCYAGEPMYDVLLLFHPVERSI